MSVLGRLGRKTITPDRLPRHIGFIPDGNRRWARDHHTTPAEGHRRGIAKAVEVIGWCDDVGIEIVTLYMLSPANLRRAADQASPDLTEDLIRALAERRRLHPIGSLDLLPARTRTVLDTATRSTLDTQGMLVNLALGYTGREDIVSAVRALLRDGTTAATGQLEDFITADRISRHISTAGQPDVDLIVRTSGEQRLSGFLTWQAEQAELHFCPRHWPDLRKVDFLRALRSYSHRQRRFGA